MAKQSTLRKSTNALVVVALTIVAAVLVNIIGNSGYARLDLTEGQLNSLSDATVELLDGFEEEVEVTVLVEVGRGHGPSAVAKVGGCV